MEVPKAVRGDVRVRPTVPVEAPAFVQRVTAPMIAGRGDLLPVSAMPVDGTFPVGTSRWERRDIAEELPRWDPAICIDCAKCTLVCPHAAIRMKVFSPDLLAGAPEGFQSKEWKSKEQPGMVMTIQVAPEDCNGCGTCADYCPAHSKQVQRHKSLDMAPRNGLLREGEGELGVLQVASRVRPHTGQGGHDQGLADAASRSSSSPARAPGAARPLT